MKKTIKNSKIMYLEFLRIIAIIFVIFNHTGINGFFMFSTRRPSSITFWLYLFMSVFCKFAVPIFFMISGILLFKKNYTIKQYVKKITRFIVIIIVLSFVYYLLNIHLLKLPFSLPEFLKALVTCKISGHFWYLYMYILLLISCPFLAMIIKNIELNHFKYLIALVLIFEGIFPCLLYLIFREELSFYYLLSPLWTVNVIVVYPCIGYFIENKLKMPDKKKLCYLWIINVLAIFITELMVYYNYRVTGVLKEAESQLFHNSFVLINAITIFITIKYLIENHKLNKFLITLSKLGKYVFGIYLLHLVITKLPIYIDFLHYIRSVGMPGFMITIIICSLMFISSLLMTIILSKIPIVKKLVGF